MDPSGQITSGKPKKTVAPSNLYTVILALSFGIVLATAILAVYKCHFEYDTIFRILK